MRPPELLDEFLRHLRVERGLSPRTWESYGYQIKSYIRFIEARGHEPASSTREIVTAYLGVLKERGLKGASIFAAAITIRGFHRFSLERRYATNDPTAGMRLPKFTQRLPNPLSVAEIEKLLSLPTGTKFHRVRFHAMLELLYATGLRVSELIGLKIGHVNLEEESILVLGKGGKERIVPFGQKAKGSLLRYLEARRNRFPVVQDTLFLNSRGQGLTRGGFWWELKRMARRAGMNGAISPHRIRHSCATAMLEGGADIRVVQEMLGHRNITTTQIYTHVSQEFLRHACEKSHPMFYESAGDK